MEGGGHWRTCPLGWKLLSCSQCQELGQRANLASDWLPKKQRTRVKELTWVLIGCLKTKNQSGAKLAL